MAWPHLLVLIRHAESVGNIRTYDERATFELATHAYPLTERGRKQAEITSTYLREHFGESAPEIYYTSYYERAKETGRILFPGVHIYEDARLAEGQRGIFHTMTKEEIETRFPEELKRKEREGLYHFRPLGGENWPDIELRIHSFLGTLVRDCEGLRVFIVVHGHWLMLFQKLIHHFSVEEALNRYKNKLFCNASVTAYKGIKRDGKSRLELIEENVIPWKDKI